MLLYIQDFLFCDMYGNMCFESSMQNVTVELDCDCPLECDSISYSFSLVSTPFTAKEKCPRQLGSGSRDFAMQEFYENLYPPQFVRKLMRMMNDKKMTRMMNNNNSTTVQEGDFCKRNIQYRAEVIFRLATNTLSVTVMSRRLSFFDKLSSFGKR